MVRRLLVAWSLGLALAACATEPQREEAPADRAPQTTEPEATKPEAAASEATASEATASARPGVPLSDLLRGAYHRWEDGSLAVLSRLAVPQRTEARPVESREVAGQVDTLRTLVYDGLALDVYEAAGGEETLREVRVTGTDYETAEGLHVGMRRSAARRRFGKAVLTGDALVELVESVPESPTPVVLRLRFAGNDLAAMTWRYGVD